MTHLLSKQSTWSSTSTRRWPSTESASPCRRRLGHGGARAQRRRQDHDGADAYHHVPARRAAPDGSRATTSSPTPSRTPQHGAHRAERHRRRAADRPGEHHASSGACRAVAPLVVAGVADELLERFSLTDAGDRTAKTYSGGMRRRLDLAVSLVATPPVLFLDEPTTGLDPRSRTELWDVLRGLVQRRHDPAAHHAVPRGGRPARRRHHRDRQGQGSSRPGHPVQLKDQAGARASTHRHPRRRPRPRPEWCARHRRGARRAQAAAGHRQGARAADMLAIGSCSSRRVASPSTTSGCSAPASTTCSCTSPGTGPRRRARRFRVRRAPRARGGPSDDHVTIPAGGAGYARPETLQPPVARAAPAIVWRNLLHIKRMPELLIDVTIQPVMFVLLFAFVFGGSIACPGRVRLQEFLRPGIMAQTMIFSSFIVAIGLTATSTRASSTGSSRCRCRRCRAGGSQHLQHPALQHRHHRDGTDRARHRVADPHQRRSRPRSASCCS